MMTRCYNPNFRQFKDYGGRGIAVCDRWRNPQLFIEDIERMIGPRPPGMTLDRIDNDGNYEPGKVKWSTQEEQVRNSRRVTNSPRGEKVSSSQPRVRNENRVGPLYRCWWRLMDRCPDEVCPAWCNWPTFRADIDRLLGPRPAGLRFDRINDKRPYEPGNVEWITGAEQIKRAQVARWGSSKPTPKHGQFRHPMYATWSRLMREFPDAMYKPWHSVQQFTADIDRLLGIRPNGKVFRRIDPAGKYEPGNVFWGTPGRPPRC